MSETAPAAAPSQINWTMVLIVAAILFLFRNDISNALNRPTDDRRPAVNAASIAEEADRLEASYQAAVCRAAAEAAGQYSTNAEFQEALRANSVKANTRAFEEFDRLTQEAIGGDRWDPARARELFLQFAEGLERRK